MGVMIPSVIGVCTRSKGLMQGEDWEGGASECVSVSGVGTRRKGLPHAGESVVQLQSRVIR